jgi:hypothetical protein
MALVVLSAFQTRSKAQALGLIQFLWPNRASIFTEALHDEAPAFWAEASGFCSPHLGAAL